MEVYTGRSEQSVVKDQVLHLRLLCLRSEFRLKLVYIWTKDQGLEVRVWCVVRDVRKGSRIFGAESSVASMRRLSSMHDVVNRFSC